MCFYALLRLTKDSNCHFIDFITYFNSCHLFKADYFSLYEFGWGKIMASEQFHRYVLLPKLKWGCLMNLTLVQTL